MNNDFRKLLEQLEKFDLSVTPRFWKGSFRQQHEMPFKEWRDFLLESYDLIGQSYAKKVYENIVYDEELKSRQLVQLRLCDAFNLIEDTTLEIPFRRAIMKCVHSGRRLDRELKPIMDEYYHL